MDFFTISLYDREPVERFTSKILFLEYLHTHMRCKELGAQHFSGGGGVGVIESMWIDFSGFRHKKFERFIARIFSECAPAFSSLEQLTVISRIPKVLCLDFKKPLPALRKLKTVQTAVEGIDKIAPQLTDVCLIHAALKHFPAKFHPDLDELTVRDNSVLLDITDLSMYRGLRNITLCSNNLTQVPRLPDTGHLTYLDVSMNNIARIENLPNSIEQLYINNNQISSIDAFPANLYTVNMWHIPLARFPENLLLCARLRYIHFHETEVNLTAMEMRFLEANTNYTPQQLTICGAAANVYRNTQNVHTSSIQASFLKSCQNLFTDNIPDQPFTGSGSAAVDEAIRALTKNTETHCVLYVTFGELFQKVWNRIATASGHEKKAELLKRLREEITDARDKCFMGQVTRLLNVLAGFYDDIFLEINEGEQIYAKVQANQRRNNSVVDIDELIAELREIHVSEDKIMEWVSALKEV